MVLARVGAGDRLNVNRPAPTRLVCHPPDDRVVEIDDVDPTVGNRPHVAWLTESPSLESHPVLSAANRSSADDRPTTSTASVRPVRRVRRPLTTRHALRRKAAGEEGFDPSTSLVDIPSR
jgi:hypothetical protein